MAVRADPTLTPSDVRALTDHYLADLDRLDRRDRGTLPFALTPAGGDRTAQIRFHEKVAAGAIDRQLEVGGILDPEAVCRIANEIGIEIEVGSPLEAEINEFLSRAFVRFHAEKADRLRRDARVGDRGWIDRGMKAIGLRNSTLPEIGIPPRCPRTSDLQDASQPASQSAAPLNSASAPVSSADDVARSLTAAIENLNDRLTNWVPASGSNSDNSSTSAGAGVNSSASVDMLWDKFVTFKIDSSNQWKRSRRPELNATIALWKWLGEPTTIDGYGLRDAARFREAYMSLPADYDALRGSIAADREHRSAEREGRSPRRVDRKRITFESVATLDRKREPTVRRVNPKTWNKHRTNLKAFFDWLISTGEYDAPNPYAALHVRIKKRGRHGRAERDAYSLEQVEQIFQMPLFQGCKSRTHRTVAGPVVVRDALFWAPIIAAYEGMRREEISQLKVHHVRQVAGIWVFDLEAEDLNLKGVDNGSGSARLVPLHRDLITAGFLDQLVIGRAADEQLFIELNDDNAHGAFGESLGRRLRYLFQKSGLFTPGEEVGIHRFRHTFSTLLENTAAKSAFIDALTGHASERSESERARYTKKIFVKNLKKTIDLLRLPINLPPPAATDLAAETSHRRQHRKSKATKSRQRTAS